ncbi:ABC transporter ATP-binding protein [Leptolyngbya sp. AN03gr2]|uniref:ABC transporter ATP-binding protein n=1 Tax=unclassified Leptolyngbya TaxID=2650499 RepID=UPI003D30FA70
MNELKIENLSFTYAGQTEPALQGINLSVSLGDIVLITGATGSGKSTLLNCLAGIVPNYSAGTLSGNILYQNQSILQWDIKTRSRYLGFLLQNVETQIFTDRVSDEIAFGLENLNLPPDQIPNLIDTALNEFGLTQQRNWAIGQLSAGQKQRLVIACILAMEQPILIMDEPFAYLDRASAFFLIELLKARSTQRQAIVLIEHRLDLVQSIATQTFHLQQEQLTTQTSFEAPLSQSNQIVLQCRNLSWGGYPPFPNLTLHAGETILLQGENGCGKTTLLKLISGLLKPTTGTIGLLGKPQPRRIADVARSVGFVLQNPNHQLFAESVKQEVQDKLEMLEQLNLQAQAEQHPRSLSQGQKRRLTLGAVLARRPKICLLDEITVGQDAASLSLMLELLKQFTQAGGAVIVTSHDPQVADRLNARIITL